MSESVETVCRRVRERVTPDADEQARMEAAVTALTDRVEAAIDDLPVAADVIQVGSTARGTWLAGDRDIDIFVRFPADIDRADLEEYGLAVGRDVLPDGREEYAEHPYTVGEIDGFGVGPGPV